MAFPYVRHSADWKDATSATGGGDTSTPITATALDTIEAGIDSLSDILENADAAGDLLVASAADAWTKLTKGADDEVLSVAAGSLDYRKVVNAMVDAAAAIAYSKLNLASSIVNADISSSAAIAQSKLSFNSFSTYVPTWTADSVNPSLGNGTIAGRYFQIGKFVFVTIKLLAGSTTTFGTGNWLFTLPIAASASHPPLVQGLLGSAYDVGSAAVYHVTLRSDGRVLGFNSATGGQSVVSSTIPFTWADTDRLEVAVAYESV